MMKTGFPRQGCPDFEDLGYCLRGDMCHMEHDVNCIMVGYVQSLLQLKLMGVWPGTILKPVTLKDPLWLNGVLTSAVTAIDADAYNPDQPLWANGSQWLLQIISVLVLLLLHMLIHTTLINLYGQKASPWLLQTILVRGPPLMQIPIALKKLSGHCYRSITPNF